MTSRHACAFLMYTNEHISSGVTKGRRSSKEKDNSPSSDPTQLKQSKEVGGIISVEISPRVTIEASCLFI